MDHATDAWILKMIQIIDNKFEEPVTQKQTPNEINFNPKEGDIIDQKSRKLLANSFIAHDEHGKGKYIRTYSFVRNMMAVIDDSCGVMQPN